MADAPYANWPSRRLEERTEQLGTIACELGRPGAAAKVVALQLEALGKITHLLAAELVDGFAVVQQQVEFEIQIEGANVKVRGAEKGECVVNGHGLGDMDSFYYHSAKSKEWISKVPFGEPSEDEVKRVTSKNEQADA